MRRPKVGLAVLIRAQNHVLLGHRIGGHANGMWGCPGGHLEGGESFDVCAIRETEEETGIMLPSAQFWTLENTVFHREGRHYVCLFMVADLPPGQRAMVMEPTKCDEWSWFQWDKLPPPLMPGLQQLVNRGANPFEVILPRTEFATIEEEVAYLETKIYQYGEAIHPFTERLHEIQKHCNHPSFTVVRYKNARYSPYVWPRCDVCGANITK